MAAQDERAAKRPKTTNGGYNPYLAHLDDEPSSFQSNTNGNSNGPPKWATNMIKDVGLKRHKSTAAQANKAEDGPNNMFNNEPLSQQYFQILSKRRDLPVQAERDEFLAMYHSTQILVFVGETGSGKTTQ